jgi:apolipoprotein N-acyltransferase
MAGRWHVRPITVCQPIFDPYGRQLGALGYGVRGAVEAPLAAPLDETLYRSHGWKIVLALIFAFAVVSARLAA